MGISINCDLGKIEYMNYKVEDGAANGPFCGRFSGNRLHLRPDKSYHLEVTFEASSRPMNSLSI